MLSNVVVRVDNLSKKYQVYDNPQDRLLQMVTRGRKKLFREHWALRDVSFELFSGETLGIVGCNGSGKSTLLQIICGTLSPTDGDVMTDGRVSALLELGAGFNPEFSGLENIYLSGQLNGLSNREIDQRLESIIEFSGVGDYINQAVKTYSSGMFVRLAFSVIAHLDPKILIVDEALSVGDFIFQQKCAKFMRETLSGVTKILVSHDLSAISSMADRVLVLDKGRNVFIGDTQTGLAVYQKFARNSLEGREVAAQEVESSSLLSASDADVEWADIDAGVLSGSGRVSIAKVRWNINGLSSGRTVKKFEKVFVDFVIEVNTLVEQPVIGYQVQNRFGTAIFGENTVSSYFEVSTLVPGFYRAQIEFLWPQIEPGEYGVTLGIGNGADSTLHVVECWAHNIIVLGSIKSDPIHGVFNNSIQAFSISGINNI